MDCRFRKVTEMVEYGQIIGAITSHLTLKKKSYRLHDLKFYDIRIRKPEQ